jgi:hypothetical protein
VLAVGKEEKEQDESILATKSSFANFFTLRKKRNMARIIAYEEMDKNYKEARGRMRITLTGEKYLLGKRISQVAPIDNDVQIERMPEGPLKRKDAPPKLLISLWNKPGYFMLERDPFVINDVINEYGEAIVNEEESKEKKEQRIKEKAEFEARGDMVYIKDDQGLSNKSWFCTDLEPIAPDLLPNVFVSRTQGSLSIVDVSSSRVFQLAVCPNPMHKFSKLSIINFGLVGREDTKKKIKSDSTEVLNRVVIALIYI